jgi:hypothetical protein
MASNAIIDGVTARGRISARDVDVMRKAYFADVAITEGEAGELFQINSACRKQAGSWKDFFAETIAGFILQQKTADGGISESNAKWLASRIGGKAKISDAERAVLSVIKQAVPKTNPVLKPLFNLVG